MNQIEELDMSGLTGELRINEPMSRHTSWRTGGLAAWFYTPNGLDDLEKFLKQLPKNISITWCGLGSNTLFRDGGFPGVVISTLKGLNRIERKSDHEIFAEAGVPSAKLAKFSAKNALCGAEFLVGIPGTVGGALAMNAGCFGGETWDVVKSVDLMDRKGNRFSKDASRVVRSYRFTEIKPGEWFVGAVFRLKQCSAEMGLKKIKTLLNKRMATQPIQTANAGSVFRNPHGDYAARLMDSAGLKNTSIGGARFSPVHANFIENQGKATALDIERLIEHAMDRVWTIHGIKLEPEVKIIGNVEKEE